VHESAKIIGDTNKGNIVQENKNRGAGGQKIGRNDPCPCGNGKKYKKCHGK